MEEYKYILEPGPGSEEHKPESGKLCFREEDKKNEENVEKLNDE